MRLEMAAFSRVDEGLRGWYDTDLHLEARGGQKKDTP
jgi:hypothetical protein